jgi:hypothetical protein
MKDIGTPIEPFVANVLSTTLDKCSDKVEPSSPAFIVRVSAKGLLIVKLQTAFTVLLLLKC